MRKAVAGRRGFLAAVVRIPEITVLIPVGLLVVVGTIVSREFLTWSNLSSMVRNASYIGIVAVCMTFLLMSRGLDLSCDSVAALTSIVLAYAMQIMNFPPWIAILLAVGVAVLVGILNSQLITGFGMPSFIVTLGMLYIARGISLILSNGGYIMMKTGRDFLAIVNTKLLGLTFDVWIFLMIAVLGECVLRFTGSGRRIVLLGTNAEAARISGIRTVRIVSVLYVMTSVGTSIGAILFTMRSVIGMNDCGTLWALQAITACVIGGTSIYGGRGSIIGTVLGVIFMALVTNIMMLANIQAEWQNVGIGLFIILGILLEVYRSRRVH
jgi:ribose transport system permease protein